MTSAIVIEDSVVEGRQAPISVRDYRPSTETSRAPLLWIHGGGFTTGSLDQRESDDPARYLASRGRWVRTVAYRLAPNLGLWGTVELGQLAGRFPAAHHDILDVAEDLRQAAGTSIDLGGGSAGANLAAGATLAMRDQATPMPRALALAYGVFHADLPENDAIERALTGPVARWAFNPKMTRRMSLNYVGDPSGFDLPYAFPGVGDVRGFPPTLILDARNDRLRRSGDAFAESLRGSGTEVRQVVIPAMHAFLDGTKKRGFAEGMAEMASWLDSHD